MTHELVNCNEKVVANLCEILSRMQQLHNELAVTIESKIKAMRSAEMDALHEVKDQEQNLLRRINEAEGARRQLMDKLGEELQMPPRTGRVMTVSQLVSRLVEPQSVMVKAAADGLRRAVTEVARSNRLAGIIAKELVNHLQRVWAAARPMERRDVYSKDGRTDYHNDNPLFDTTG
ncbi:MAG: flagellar export chaperone FlgN [Phycisphaerae bacterium]